MHILSGYNINKIILNLEGGDDMLILEGYYDGESV